MPMPEYRCVRDACGWQGDEPDWEEADEDTSPDVPSCPRCKGEVEERIRLSDSQTGFAAYEVPRDPIRERRDALLDYLNSTITWRADHLLQIGPAEMTVRSLLQGLAGDAVFVPFEVCDSLGLRDQMTYGQLVAWIKDRLACRGRGAIAG
jgi:hypothetical protein